MKRYNIGPLQVFYAREAPPSRKVGDAFIGKPYALSLSKLKESIELGEIDRIFIIGRGACTGWKVKVDREVVFFEYKGPMADFARESAQAQGRIVSQPEGE